MFADTFVIACQFDRELMPDDDSAPSEGDTASLNQQMEGETLEVSMLSIGQQQQQQQQQ